MEQLENKEFCKKCGGYCCKKCGCDYFTRDFKTITLSTILEKLEEGNTSIVAALKIVHAKNNKILVNPLLYLRARNRNRDVIDLLSFKTTCSMLTDEGCKYSINERPGGGVNLIPAENRYSCHPKEDQLALIKEWGKYQQLLERIVKRYTGMSVEQKLRQDVENLFYKIMIDDYEEAVIEEIEDVKNMIPLLIRAYPNEFKNANERTKTKEKTKIKVD